MTPTPPFQGVILDDQITGRTRTYRDPIDIVSVTDPADLADALDTLEAYRVAGQHLAGWLSYDIGAAIEPALPPIPLKATPDTPLLQVGVFNTFDPHLPAHLVLPDAELSLDLVPDWSEADYLTAFARVQAYIRAGDIYQVNLTFPMRGETDHSAESLFRNLRTRQRGAYGGLAALGDTELISFSPELFIAIENGTATLRPMKGTLPRHPDPAKDAAAREAMTRDEKSRAENLMIVDLLRNDLSRLATPGSVKVPDLFTPETYATVHQMTSTVTGKVGHPTLAQLIQALFPCGSVTGAPKIRAMQIIDELEDAPRGPYCGSLFYMDPDGTSCFNVAIRTLVKRGRELRYDIGSGIVSDSDGPSEYAECLLKADLLKPLPPNLIETLRLGPQGFVRLDLHMNRLERSARDLNIPFDFHAIMAKLTEVEASDDPQRIRIELLRNSGSGGGAHILVTPLIEKRTPLRAIAGSRPLTPAVQPTAHKVTNRAFYDTELARALSEGADEAILLNAAGEVCEGCFTSVFVESVDADGTPILLTPPLTSGLLPGILRETLLANGRAREHVLHWDDLLAADTLYLGNSLRGLMLTEIV